MFSVVTLSQGQTLVGDVGCEVMLRIGTAVCGTSDSVGLIDTTRRVQPGQRRGAGRQPPVYGHHQHPVGDRHIGYGEGAGPGALFHPVISSLFYDSAFIDI